MSGSSSFRIGNQTYFAAPRMEPFDFAVSNAFSAFEWFPERRPLGQAWAGSDIDPEHRARIRQIAEVNDIRLSVHGPLDYDPYAPDDGGRLRETVEFARDIGAALINLHLDPGRGADSFARAIRPAVELTGGEGLRLALENTFHCTPRDCNEAFAAIRRQLGPDAAHVGMCFDLGHANISPTTTNDYLAFLDQLSGEVPIIHLHLHENWGDGDTHLTPFTGPSGRDDRGLRGVVSRLVRRGFDGSIILEVWPERRSDLLEARDRLLAMVEPPGIPV